MANGATTKAVYWFMGMCEPLGASKQALATTTGEPEDHQVTVQLVEARVRVEPRQDLLTTVTIGRAAHITLDSLQRWACGYPPELVGESTLLSVAS